MEKNKGYLEAYIDVIALLESTEIVEFKGQPVLCDTCKLKNEKFMPSCLSHNAKKCFAYQKEETTEAPQNDQRFYTKYEEPKIVTLGDQFREFVDSLDNQTYFVNAKNVIGLSIEKQRNKYYINIYVGQMVVLEYETKEDQEKAYNELKEWVKRWNS